MCSGTSAQAKPATLLALIRGFVNVYNLQFYSKEQLENKQKDMIWMICIDM